jgi:hypothetical protein
MIEGVSIFSTWDMAMKKHKYYKNIVFMLIHGGLAFKV